MPGVNSSPASGPGGRTDTRLHQWKAHLLFAPRNREEKISEDEDVGSRYDLIESELDEGAKSTPKTASPFFGTILNGMKIGPSNTRTAVATYPNMITYSVTACAARMQPSRMKKRKIAASSYGVGYGMFDSTTFNVSMIS